MGAHSLVGDNRSDDQQTFGDIMLFGREPALFLGLVSGVVQFVSAMFLPLSDAQQGAVNIVASCAVAVALAWKVSAEKAAAALVGLVTALIAAALAFGFDLSAEVQSGVMVAVVAVASFWVRGQVVAPVPPAEVPVYAEYE